MSEQSTKIGEMLGASVHEVRLDEVSATEQVACTARNVPDMGTRIPGSGMFVEIRTQNRNQIAAVFQMQLETGEDGKVEGHLYYAPDYNAAPEQIGHYIIPPQGDGFDAHPVFIVGRLVETLCLNFEDRDGRDQIPVVNANRSISGLQAICEIKPDGTGPEHAIFVVTNSSERGTIVRSYWPDVLSLRK